MAPRVGAAASGVGDTAFRFVLSVLKHCEQVKADWNEVAKENGIAYARNASARFKSILEQHGLRFENGAITILKDVGTGVTAAKPCPTANGDGESKPPKRAKYAAATTSTSRKRKLSTADPDESAASAPMGSKRVGVKKKMKSESLVKAEEDAEEDSQVAPAKKSGAKNDGGNQMEDETLAEKTSKTDGAEV
ncbi:hypothetical protein CLAIMM_10513 [Cladophialophora immunda]|nr:hypothetical protein CLAIMM_10513 [Cladophialophora immunda]